MIDWWYDDDKSFFQCKKYFKLNKFSISDYSIDSKEYWKNLETELIKVKSTNQFSETTETTSNIQLCNDEKNDVRKMSTQ